jgi:hypothetical protein
MKPGLSSLPQIAMSYGPLCQARGMKLLCLSGGRADYGPSFADIAVSNPIGSGLSFVSVVCFLGYIKKYADSGTRSIEIHFRRLLVKFTNQDI